MIDMIDSFYDGSEGQLEVRRLVTTGVQLFLYGMYIPLFGVCIHVIRKRKRGNYKLHITLTTALFILCTTTVILNLINVAEAVKMEMPTNLAMIGVYMLANVCADLIMLQRCYVIWGANIYIIVIPFIGLCINFAFGVSVLAYKSTYLVVFFIMTLVENIILTSLTAGKIFWINHEAGIILGSAVQTRYRMIAAMIMESSILYSTAIIAGVVSIYARNVLASEIAVNSQTQLVGIAPTLLVVRVGLGIDVKDVIGSVKVISMAQSQTHTLGEEDIPLSMSDSDPDVESGELVAATEGMLITNEEIGYNLKPQIFYPQNKKYRIK
ncbi:hypothetical protein K435DRAFT_969017 [Dendrothele bispora CBS 962.96]|uniref:Uncharacterized protein n=1 Tax=Dendrothele bispora (strain CBS 962.96) TaxID=1314807 RepID=A0A4S8LLJ9_DENBC|nr:hypothetical protein K435DRAFT_969017 [Dendrothele bispora CBS 962.96]